MMRRAMSCGALTLVVACTVPPGISAEQGARYDVAAKSLGCTLRTEGDYLAMELQTGMARQQLIDISAFRLSTGGAQRLPDGGLKLTTGACA